MLLVFFFKLYGDHRALHLLTHSFPTRLSSDLRGATALVAGVLALAAFALPAGWSPPRPAPETLAAERLVWQPLDATAIAGLVAGGQVVFVDVTAAWCITCQVNKKLVLEHEAVRARLRSEERRVGKEFVSKCQSQ